MSYVLRYDYPCENVPDTNCPDLDAVRRELADNVAGEPQDLEAILRELLQRGQWNDEGGSIKLFVQCGTAGVGGNDAS